MFKAKIKSLRTAKNISQDEIAEAIGVSSRTYMDYENGKNEPKLSKALAIAEFLEVPLTILISEEDEEGHRLENMNRILKGLNEEDRAILD
ncbi:helix-turn-helix transcriptional regulator, partial [Vibrio sp. 10N.261.48.A2]